jgi:hypothetical protein
MLRRGEFAREGDALVETATGRRVLFFPHLMRLTVSDGCCFTEGDLVRYYHARYGVEHTIQGVVERDQLLYV